MHNGVVSLLLASALSLPASAYAAPQGEMAEVRGPSADATIAQPIREAIRDAIQQSAQPNAQWQQQYDAALAKRSKGRAWMLVGTGIIAAGVTMIATDTAVFEDCDVLICTIDYRVPALVTATGASALVWGIIQHRDSARTLRDLEAQRRLQVGSQSTISIWRGTVVALGPEGLSLGHNVSW